jgi:6-pyruvoyltetrahydropterin/6-carboxytetrahydropterin synthase
MFYLAVKDHIMIAHSFNGDIFGPAQNLHGATFEVEVEVRREQLDKYGLVCDIGRAIAVLREVLSDFNYKNLDSISEFKGKNTTTEFMAGEIFERMRQRISNGELGPDTSNTLHSMKVVLKESFVAWAAFEATFSNN